MSNLTELAWTYSFDMMALGASGLIAYLIYCLKKKTIDKVKLLVLILLISYFTYVGMPYIQDYIDQETNTLYGIVLEEKASTYKLSRTVYSYTLQAENGEQVVVFVDEQFRDTFGMKTGRQYTISYFTHSNAVSNVIE